MRFLHFGTIAVDIPCNYIGWLLLGEGSCDPGNLSGGLEIEDAILGGPTVEEIE